MKAPYIGVQYISYYYPAKVQISSKTFIYKML